MRTALLSILLTFCCYPILSQETFSITGIVTDSMSKEALSAVTIKFRKTKDTLFLNTVTTSKGRFVFNNVASGKYILDVSHVGYEAVAKEIVITGDEHLVIYLLRASAILSNVTVLPEKRLVTQTQEKITYNLSEGAATASDNLYNIILKIPGVTESNSSLFYQGKPLSILLDGKLNNMAGEDLKSYLSGMLGTSIDKLEVLLNPSSRHDAQSGAVFNLRSLKNKNYGLTKSITLGAGTGNYFRSNAGFTLNYRDSNINIYGGYDFNHQKQFFLLTAFMGFDTSPATIYLVDDNVRTNNNHSVRLGMDYDLTKKTSVGLLFKGFQNYRRRAVLNNSVYSPGNNAMDTVVQVITNTNAVFKSPSLNLFLRTRLFPKGADFILNLDYFGFHKIWDEDLKATYADKQGNTAASPDFQLNRSPADNSVKSVTADYLLPLKKGNLEIGVKVTNSKTDNDVLWQQYFNTAWQTDSGKTNHFIYKEDVYASYINLSKNYKKLAVQAGIRFEATRSDGISITTNMKTGNKYVDFFPSVSLEYKPAKDQQLSVNYRKSIKRFGFDIINPFIVTQGPYSYHQGNPYIKPSYFSSANISWAYKSKLLIGAGFSAVKNSISYGYRKYGNTNASLGSYLNFSAGRLYNSNISYTARLFKGKWTSMNSLTFLHSALPDFDSQIQHNNNYALNTINNILFPKSISVELSAFYKSPLLDGTVRQSATYGLTVGASILVLRSKGSLRISCTDVFNTQIFHNRTDGDGIRIDAYWKPESRFGNLLFTYRFGNLNVKASKNRKTGIEDEKNRMGAN